MRPLFSNPALNIVPIARPVDRQPTPTNNDINNEVDKLRTSFNQFINNNGTDFNVIFDPDGWENTITINIEGYFPGINTPCKRMSQYPNQIATSPEHKYLKELFDHLTNEIDHSLPNQPYQFFQVCEFDQLYCKITISSVREAYVQKPDNKWPRCDIS